MKKRAKSLAVIDVSEIPVLALRAKQSVRATFKLSQRCILALSALSSQLGIKQKSLFDHLMDDQEILAGIAEKFECFKKDEKRITKTFVISRKTLNNLEKISAGYQTPRDALVQLSIERVMPLLALEKKRYQERKRIMEELQDYQQSGEQLLAHTAQLLDEDDPLLEKMAFMMKNIRKSCHDAQQFMSRCCKMEEI